MGWTALSALLTLVAMLSGYRTHRSRRPTLARVMLATAFTAALLLLWILGLWWHLHTA